MQGQKTSPTITKDSLTGRKPVEKEQPDIAIVPFLTHAEACKEVGKKEYIEQQMKEKKAAVIDDVKSSNYKLPETVLGFLDSGMNSKIFAENHYNFNKVLDVLVETTFANREWKYKSTRDTYGLGSIGNAEEEYGRKYEIAIKTAIVLEMRRSEAMLRLATSKKQIADLQKELASRDTYIEEQETALANYARIIMLMGKMWNTLYRVLIGRAKKTEFLEIVQSVSAYDNELIEDIPDIVDDIEIPLACLSSEVSLTKGQALIQRQNMLTNAFDTMNSHLWYIMLMFTLFLLPSSDPWIISGTIILLYGILYMYNKYFFSSVLAISREIDEF